MTGVQTCALPISPFGSSSQSFFDGFHEPDVAVDQQHAHFTLPLAGHDDFLTVKGNGRARIAIGYVSGTMEMEEGISVTL